MRPSDFYDSEIQSECEFGLVRMDRMFKVWRFWHHAKASLRMPIGATWSRTNDLRSQSNVVNWRDLRIQPADRYSQI